MSEWLSMESAPRDGTAILIFCPARKEPPSRSGYVVEHDEVIQVAFWRLAHLDWVEAHGEQYETYEPTHWMPLPAAPDPSPK